MAKYTITFSCGHEGVVNLFGKSADREDKIRWYEEHALCPACYEKSLKEAREKQQAQLKERAEELGLPELTGTEKQIKWATEIRGNFSDGITKNLGYYSKKPKAQRAINAWASFCYSHDKASWWIEHREMAESTVELVGNIMSGIAALIKSGTPGTVLDGLTDEELGIFADRAARGEEIKIGVTPVTKDEIDALEETEAERRASCTVKPEEVKSQIHAEISIRKLEGGRQIVVSTPERIEEVVELVKGRLGYKWASGAWRGNYDEDNPVIDDRVCEIAAKILKCGYAVELPKKELVARVINGEYKPYNPRRIFKLGEDKFIVYWGKDEDWYRGAKRLPGAKWNSEKGGVVVPGKSWALVEDFAERNKFDLSPGAQELIAVSKEADRKALVCEDIKTPETETHPVPGRIPKLEAKEEAVDASLVDDEAD
ncbi:hypothetical protein [Cloacibacillus sp. An23]|uniref:hypothetical protein n=1 Tax=Cloacibacillus sp. An23 TaxID=1965591 RepID=UPI000B3687F2|nr:hypothetical protein [Cloacibacillus sp. An23]OUO94828.1 hypothetical protein B5F39_02870 [Cloacibacillus sp. An23]